MKLIKHVKDLKQKRVFLRVDFNVDIRNNKVVDNFRIERAIPTLKYLLKKDCQVIVATHLGRPGGKLNNKFSMESVVKEFRRLVGQPVKFFSGKVNVSLLNKLVETKSKLIMLDNLRFNSGEKKNDPQFAEMLAAMADVYVNEAFAVSHRKAASIVGITKFLPSYAGITLTSEIKQLQKLLKPKKPAVALVGGIKIESKFGVLETYLQRYSKVLLGGGIAAVFLKAQGFKIGDSICDSRYVAKVSKLNLNKIITPIDFVIADMKTQTKVRYHKLEWGKEICEKGEMILDIGPESLKKFEKEINKAKTIVWAGAFGAIEVPKFAKGSRMLAQIVAGQSRKSSVLGIVGGGSVLSIVSQTRTAKYYDFISTGGGAMLEFLEGKSLVGIEALY